MDLAKMSLVDLRLKLGALGLDTKGSKPALFKRLRNALEERSVKAIPETSIFNTTAEDEEKISAADPIAGIRRSSSHVTSTPSTPAKILQNTKLKKMGNRPTYTQLEALVEFLEHNPGIARGLLRTAQAKVENKRKWNKIAITINALGGVQKNGAGWSKYWVEKKCALKKNCAQRAQSMQCTGGGKSQDIPSLSALEQRMVAIMGGQNFPLGNDHLSVNLFPQRSQDDLANPPATDADNMEVLIIQEGEVVNEQSWSRANVEAVQSSKPNLSDGQSRRQRGRCRLGGRSRLDVEVDRMARIEERRVDAEAITAQALKDACARLDRCADAFHECATAIRESGAAMANALLEIARRLPNPQ